jgi:MSHA pilin protein MshD
MSRGFTLIELVIGIVVLGAAMLVMNTMLISQSKDSLEPLYRLRAAQFGQSIMQTILARAYDENSDHNGGYYRCGEVWGNDTLWYDGISWVSGGTATVIACSDSDDYGIDSGETAGEHQDFNDVDDFITGGFESLVSYGDVLGNELAAQYNSYAVKIVVSPDNSSGIAMKRIDVAVRTPSGEEIILSALKGNY